MKEKAAWVMTAHQARNLPLFPGISANCVKGPGFFQYLNPIRSWLGPPIWINSRLMSSKTILLTTQIQNNAKNYQANNADNLDGCENKLSLAICT